MVRPGYCWIVGKDHMLFHSAFDSLAFAVGFVVGIFGLLFALAWLEHPTAPTWWIRLRSGPPRPRSAELGSLVRAPDSSQAPLSRT
jgi:hypothetical protein